MARRNERPVYQWTFEYMQKHYDMISPDTPETRLYKKEITEDQFQRLDGPVNPRKKVFCDPQEAAKAVTEFAMSTGVDLVGFTAVKESFMFQGEDIDHGFAVVLAVEMDYDKIMTAPAEPSGIEVLRVYWKLGETTVKVAEFIRLLGYRAKAHHPRRFLNKQPSILHTAAAIESGLGELGRHGVLITEEFGPRIRVATVTTELELP